MLFNSYEFLLLFLPICLAGFFLIGSRSARAAALWLAVASLVFYGWWSLRYVSLLLASIAFNYVLGVAIARRVGSGRQRQAGVLLLFGVAINLATLGYFKYAQFFVGTIADLTGTHLAIATVVLPLGISFFTFTQIAFLVDARRGEVAEYDPIHYLLFVTYFPHLIAGPIIHHKEMMPQFDRRSTYRIDATNIALGLSALGIGLFKKVVLADSLARFAAPVFAVASREAVLFYEAWIGALAYTLQLYFDFSAYCDMAIGLSLLLGIKLPLNFNSPYKSSSIIDFWRRWHMTLSRFLREYLYFPLGGNRHGPRRRQLNLFLTMLLGGLWHGASWTFVVWGGLHGVYLAVNHWWRDRPLARRLEGSQSWLVVSTILTFTCVVVGWVFFRATSFAAAARIVWAMFDLRGALILPEQIHEYLRQGESVLAQLGFRFRFGRVPLILDAPLWIVPLLVVVWFAPNVQDLLGAGRIALTQGQVMDGPAALWQPTAAWAIVIGILIATALLSMQVAGEFLYYQF